jgi:hypothetical protein
MLNRESLWHQRIFGTIELLVLPLTEAGSSERPRFCLRFCGISRWYEGFLDMWKSLILLYDQQTLATEDAKTSPPDGYLLLLIRMGKGDAYIKVAACTRAEQKSTVLV